MLERLRTNPDLDVDLHLTPNHQQLIEHNRYVKLALERYDIASPLREFGRRASNVAAWASELFGWLRGQGLNYFSESRRSELISAIGTVVASIESH